MKDAVEPVKKGAISFGAAVVLQYADEVRRYIDRRLRKRQEVDDLAHEVYLRLLQLDSKAEIRNPLAYVFGIAAHVLADHRRRNAREQAACVGESSTACTDLPSDASADRLEEFVSVEQQLLQALGEIAPMHAAVLVLHNHQGLSHEEVAAELNLSVHTVRKYLTQGRAQIRMKFRKRKGA